MLAVPAFVACTEALAPLDVTAEDLEWAAHGMMFEIESGLASLTATGAMNVAFNVQQSSQYPPFEVVDPECGLFSQSPPVDSDADGVPDNLTFTFAGPTCHFPYETGSREATGVIRMSDPLPGMASPAFTMTLEDLGSTIEGPELTGFASRDGWMTVSASGSGLSQIVSWLETSHYAGYATFGVGLDWSATFTAAQGSTITAGEPIPDGIYMFNGSIRLRRDARSARFIVTTIEPLQYNPACVTAMAQGLGWTPFSAGVVRVAVQHNPAMGFYQTTYTDCTSTFGLISG
jgi:hypothetical protein